MARTTYLPLAICYALLSLLPACVEESTQGDIIFFFMLDAGQEEALSPEADVPVVTVNPDGKSCTTNCGGKECGPDGCGGSCGNCFTLEGAVDNSLCSPSFQCQTCSCAGKSCGLNECGASCGTCPGNYTCNAAQQCQAPPMQCDQSGFPLLEQQAKGSGNAGGFEMHYQSASQSNLPFDAMVLQIDSTLGGPAGPGTFDAPYTNLGQGGIWLYVLKGWDGEGYQALMVPTQGSIQIVSLNSAGGPFKAQLLGVVLEPASFNESTLAVTVTPGGPNWCLDGLTLAADLVIESCVPQGTGPNIGNKIKNFQLQNCNGQWINLHDKCGQSKALWIVATAGW